MARGHWLDPFARSLLEATGQLPRRPRPSDPSSASTPGDSRPSSSTPSDTNPTERAPAREAAIEQDLLELKLRQNPSRRLSDAAEARQAAALGWRLDVNRASAADWLRLPGIKPSQVDLLLRLQQGGVQLSGPEDLQRLLDLPPQQLAVWEPLLQFNWYSAAPAGSSRPRPVDLNHASPTSLEQQLPQLNSERRLRLLRERQRAPFSDLADLQQRLQLPPTVVEALIGRVRFGQGPAGPQLPRSA